MNQWLVRQKTLLDLKSTNLLKWRTVWQEPTRWLEVDHSKTDGRTQIGCALSSWWMQLFSLRLFPSLSTLILSLMTTGTLYLHSEQMLSGCVRVFLTKRVSIRDSSPRAFTWRGLYMCYIATSETRLCSSNAETEKHCAFSRHKLSALYLQFCSPPDNFK